MKKRLMLLALAAIMLLCGCSLVATKDAGSADADKSADAANAAVVITDKYSFENPADLDFDARYVVYCDQNSAMIAALPAEYGVQGSFSILFGKEDAPLGDYEFYICDTAEHAQALKDLYATTGTTLNLVEEDGRVLYGYSDGDTVEASIIVMQSYGMVEETTLSAYVEFLKTTYGGTIQE